VAIRKLEEHFHCGVLCEESGERPSIRDVLRLSVIVSFTTSEKSWKDVARGELLLRPPGPATVGPDGREESHACLVEGYNLDDDVAIAKNSWGHETGDSGRFSFRWDAFHHFSVFKVFFTLSSIAGKTVKTYPGCVVSFLGQSDGR
jgi:hypothetical protein